MKTWGERTGELVSFWERTAKKFKSAPLTENLTTDVCVVGAGIAGVTTAYLLARERKNVVLIDDGPVGGGMTGRTTAQLVNAIDDRYLDIEKFLGEECARLTAESHTAAIDLAEKIVGENKIDCNFERVDGYLFLPPGGSVKDLMEERDAAQRAGISGIERVDEVPNAKIKSDAVLRWPRQAQFHPLKYLDGVARAIVDLGGKIFTGTRVLNVKDGDRVIVETSDGPKVTAQAAVVTTHCPINDLLVRNGTNRPRAFLGHRADGGRGKENYRARAVSLRPICARHGRGCLDGRRPGSQERPSIRLRTAFRQT
jgi:glycine/D-amino acid oxidase-like deaminating enzyme